MVINTKLITETVPEITKAKLCMGDMPEEVLGIVDQNDEILRHMSHIERSVLAYRWKRNRRMGRYR